MNTRKRACRQRCEHSIGLLQLKLKRHTLHLSSPPPTHPTLLRYLSDHCFNGVALHADAMRCQHKTGKTSTVLALAQSLYGPNIYKKRILEMNASDERGIQGE